MIVDFQDRFTGKPDLSPSFYRTESEHKVQITAEHMAVAGLRLTPSNTQHVDLVNTVGGGVHDTPTDPDLFAFASAAHVEIAFKSEDDLVGFIDTKRTICNPHKLGKRDVANYVNSKRAKHDQEWNNFLSSGHSMASEWRAKCDEIRDKS